MSISESIQAKGAQSTFRDPYERPSNRPFKQQSPFMTVIGAVASLRLTVILLALSGLLVFFGTLAQVQGGIWTIVAKYFRAVFVWIPFDIFTQAFQINLRIPGGFPFPGGWLLGGLLMTNLLAAHVLLMSEGYKKWRSGRLGFPWRLPGILLIHSGLVVLFVGEFITGMYAVEGHMSVSEHQTTNEVIHNRFSELAVIDSSGKDSDIVVAVPASRLVPGQTIKHEDLPFNVQVLEYFVNSDVRDRQKSDKVPANLVGTKVAVPHAEVPGTSQENRVDTPSMYAKLIDKKTGQPLGTFLFSLLVPSRPVMVGDKSYDVSLRFKHSYRPYYVHLRKFHFDRFPGIDMAKNFASDVTVVDPERTQDMQVTIRMNEPLRYRGETFYQAGWDEETEKGTVLQVVDNWGWLLPYISCVMVALGMMVHFSISVVRFAMKTFKNSPRPALEPRMLLVPGIALAVGAAFFTYTMRPQHDMYNGMNLAEFGRLPVVHNGRLMPMHSFASNSLMLISGNTSWYDNNGNNQSANRWLLDVFIWKFSDTAAKAKVFRIDNDNVLNLLNLKHRPGFRYAFEEFEKHLDKVAEGAKSAAMRKKKGEKLDVDQEKVLELHQRLGILRQLVSHEVPLSIPPETMAADPAAGWSPMIVRLQEMQEQGHFDGPTKQYIDIIGAYEQNDAAKFNQAVASYKRTLARQTPSEVNRASFESFFNTSAPFYHCLIMYVVIFLLAAFSWFGWHSETARSAAFSLLLLTVVIHTFALFGRMYLLNRPFVFVTNLYSSAVFIGWGCVLLGIVLELVLKRSIGIAVAAKIGFLSLLVAQLLAISGGDTMAPLVAVLDTNFWLATHVTSITIGYAATFVAGFLGIGYIFLSLFGNPRDRNIFPMLSRAIYGVVCFATLFSFVGTVLGGIWADQSWGRFWGWDPKENGALIIVIWNALILHARWGGVLKHPGIAVAAVVGNIVTAWSWFGVNLLGVGLHSYGFSKETLYMLISFVMFNLTVINAGIAQAKARNGVLWFGGSAIFFMFASLILLLLAHFEGPASLSLAVSALIPVPTILIAMLPKTTTQQARMQDIDRTALET